MTATASHRHAASFAPAGPAGRPRDVLRRRAARQGHGYTGRREQLPMETWCPTRTKLRGSAREHREPALQAGSSQWAILGSNPLSGVTLGRIRLYGIAHGI